VNTKGAIKKGQSRETGNTGYTRRRKTKTQHIAVSVLLIDSADQMSHFEMHMPLIISSIYKTHNYHNRVINSTIIIYKCLYL